VIPDAVAAAWGWQRRGVTIDRLLGGLINQTYVVRDGAPLAVLQRLHPVFGPEVNLDLDAVTTHLASKQLVTPRLLRTRDDRPWVEHDGVWRALTWIDGETVHAVPSPAWAGAGGDLVGRFHRAMWTFRYDYRFARAGVHDTAAHLGKLASRVEAGGDAEAVSLGREILDAARALPPLPATPRRHVHGDLKISNILFSTAGGDPCAVCLVDLDTLGLGTMAFELGDMLRSWCNPRGEDAGSVAFDLAIFGEAIAGFRAAADAYLSEDERLSIVPGLETVCIELASRFAVDVFDDSYFGWDPARFPSRRAHNFVRARGQLALGLAVRAARDEATALVVA